MTAPLGDRLIGRASAHRAKGATFDADLLEEAAKHHQALTEALRPFADLGVGLGPDDEVDAAPYRILRGAIRKARAVIAEKETA